MQINNKYFNFYEKKYLLLLFIYFYLCWLKTNYNILTFVSFNIFRVGFNVLYVVDSFLSIL